MGMMENLYARSPLFLQTVLLNAKALELYFERYGPKFWKISDEFSRNQWLSRQELIEYQNDKLRRLIKHSYDSVPYYRNLMSNLKLRPDDFRTVDDLYKLPVLRREDVKKNRDALLSRRYPKVLLRHGHTSGTTGSPLDFWYDIKTCVVHHVADWRQKIWAGLKYGEPYASLQGRVIVPIHQKRPPFWRKSYINNQLFLSSFHLREDYLEHYFDKLGKDGIQFIEGYPSTVYILAIFLLKRKQVFPMRAVLTSSETLYDHQRAAIEKSFQCKVFDFYGMAERVVYATECDQHSGHHVNLDYGIAEFLNSSNEPVSPGKIGKLVATGLHNFAMPLIRYETNDSSALKIEECPCGRQFPLLEDVTTKVESIVTLPDGRLISPSVLTHPFKPQNNIAESQIVQERPEELIVRIVKKSAYTQADEEALIAAFKERLGDQLQIQVRYVDTIPRTKSGKLKWIVSSITPKF